MYQDEINTETILRYLRDELAGQQKTQLEHQLEERELWRDRLAYVELLIDELNLGPEDPFDLCFLTISYEIRIREEKVKILMENFLKEEQSYLELEPEIDTLLEKIERQVEQEGRPPAPIKTTKPLKSYRVTKHLKAFGQRQIPRVWNALLPLLICSLGGILQNVGQAIKFSSSDLEVPTQSTDKVSVKDRLKLILLQLGIIVLCL